MRITAVEAIPYEITYRRPVRFASGQVATARDVLVRIRTDEGLVGHAEALPRPYTYGESQVSIVNAVGEWFAPALIGVDPFARETVRQFMGRVVGNHTARAAIDVAIWDLIGQAVGQSVHSLLGAFSHKVAVTHMLGFGPASDVIAEAIEMRERHGITSFKIKVGRDVSEDVNLCRALRTALGDDVHLYIDANRGWTAEQAIAAVRMMSNLNLSILEEPTRADEILGRRRVVQTVSMPVLGDESCSTLGDAARQLLGGTATMISIKVARTGFSESQRFLSFCEALGVGVVVGSQLDGALGTLAAASFAGAFQSTTIYPAELTNFLGIADHLLVDPPTISDGFIHVNQTPGIGATIDKSKLDLYRIDT